MSNGSPSGTLHLDRPDQNRPPMVSNAFTAARLANTALAPMFPYLTQGCMVPGITVFRGGEGRDIGAFMHRNSVDEVAICFSSRGSGVRSGDVFAGAREHLVGSFFDQGEADENLMVIVVVQRQAESGSQHEGLGYICEKCQSRLLDYEFSTMNDGRDKEPLPGYVPPLDTLIEGGISAAKLNSEPGLLKCKECGHQNEAFPIDIWGWETYRKTYEATEEARNLYFNYISTIGKAG